jgi:hypothetical protein
MQDLEPSSESPPRGRRRQILTVVVAALAFGAGAATGISVGDDTAELDAAHSQTERFHGQVTSLKSTVADLRNDNAALASSREKAQTAAEAAGEETAAKERRLDARAAELDEREAELDSREAELDDQEESFALPNSSSTTSPSDRSSSNFDSAWAVDIASDIVHDVKTVDQRLGDGIAVESAMFLLSDDFPRLLDAGIPPGVREAQYVARLQTLESFTDEAADLYASDPTEGSARYAVVREQTGVLLEQLNSAVGSDFTLP